MSLSVREALTIDSLKKAIVIGGKKSIDRIIASVDIAETPDTYFWVQENQFIITSCYSIKDDHDAQLKLIHSMARVNAAALAIKFDRYIGYIPPEMVKLANELSLPLISLPTNIPYVDISTPIMQKILDKKNVAAEFAEKARLRLTQSLMETNSIPALCSELGKIIKQKIKIYPQKTDLSHIKNADTSNIFPINIKDEILGYIVIENKNPLGEKENMVIAHAQTLAALQMKNMQLIVSNPNEQRDFIEDLLTGQMLNTNTIIERAAEIGFNIAEKNFLIIVDFDDFSTYLLKRNVSEKISTNIKHKLLTIVHDVIYMNNKQNLIVQQSDRVIAIIAKRNFNNMTKKEYFESLFEKIHEKVEKQIKQLTVTIGMSDEILFVHEIAEKYKNMRQMMSFYRKVNGNGKNVFWENAEIYLLLSNTENAVKLLHKSIFSKFRNNSIKNSAELFKTLEIYIKCDGNLVETAKELCIHRNTLRYRLQKLEQILDRNLTSTETKFLLWLALKEIYYHK